MKKTKLQWVLLLLLVMQTGLKAQTWTASSIAEGTFYFYNVGAGKFLCNGTQYGTRASLTAQGGIPLTLKAVDAANGVYSVSSAPTYDGLYMGVGIGGSEAYLDVSATASNYSDWKFIPVADLENTYLIQSRKTGFYMVRHPSHPSKTSVTSAAVPTSDNGYWKLVTRKALVDNMVAHASAANPIDATFAVLNHSFSAHDASKGRWTYDRFTAWGGPDEYNKCVEQWNNTYDMYQVLTDMPNGVYTFKCQGFYRMGGGNNDATLAAEARNKGTETLNAKYYLNTTEGALKSILDYGRGNTYNTNYNTSASVTVHGAKVYVPNSLDRAARCFEDGEYWNEDIKAVVTNGTLRIGFRKADNRNNDWAAYDNVVLTYCGQDLSALIAGYEEVLAKAQALQQRPMLASVRNQLEEAIATATAEVNKQDYTSLETRTTLLTEAVSAAENSISLYENQLLPVLETLKAKSKNEGVKDAIQTMYDKGEYSAVTDVYAAYQTLEISALGTAENTDYTSVIVNGGYELHNNDGWYGTPSLGGTDENWCAEEYDKAFDVYQTITGLPNGYYSMNVQGFYRMGLAETAGAARAEGREKRHAYYYINDEIRQLKSIFDSELTATSNDTYNASTAVLVNGTACYLPDNMQRAAACFSKGEYQNTPITVLVSDGTIRFGVKKTTLQGLDWAIWDNFTLTYLCAYAPSNYDNAELAFHVENDDVQRYLSNTTYTEESASVIDRYNTDDLMRNDQPASVLVPLPEQTYAATLTLSLTNDYSSARTYTVPAGHITYKLTNLIPSRTYYYKVVGDSNAVVAKGTITPNGSLRMIKADGISNVRDLGGWTTTDGNRVKYGKLFRGSELRGGKTYTASDADLVLLRDDLGIVAEVDFREDVDFKEGTMNRSALDGATYYYANLNRWGEEALRMRQEDFKAAFNLIYDAVVTQDKAAYFHCIFGADRTGCFAFLVEGLLGLNVDQMYKDYELTSFSSAGVRAKAGIDSKLNYIKLMPGNTLQERFFNYWRYAVGIDKDRLLAFINVMTEGSNPKAIEHVSDYVCTPLVADGPYYLYFPKQEKFLARGMNYGTRGITDPYGIPAEVSTDNLGVTTVKFLDNNLYLGSDGYTDKADDFSSIAWGCERDAEGYVLRSANGRYLSLTEDGQRVRVDAEKKDATPLVFKTRAEQEVLVDQTQKANVLAAAAAAGLAVAAVNAFDEALSADYVAVPSTAIIRSANVGNKNVWTFTSNAGDTYNVGDYGAELFQTSGTVSQTVRVSHAGLYKLTLNAFCRQGDVANCHKLGDAGYELSNAYVSVNDTYFARIPSWYSGHTGDQYPNRTDEAKERFDAGAYKMEVYAYIGDTKKATITIHVPGNVPGSWCIFNNFALTEYAKKVVLAEDATLVPEACDFANATLTRTLSPNSWNAVSFPFALTASRISASDLKGATIYAFAQSNATEVTFKPVTSIEAGKPYLINPVAKVVNPTFAGVAVRATEGETMGAEGNVQFVAQTYNRSLAEVSNVCYLTPDGTLKRLAAGDQIQGLRAYFVVPGDPASVKLFWQEADAMESIREESMESRAGIYSLTGQRLSKPQRGINIINGKKRIVR